MNNLSVSIGPAASPAPRGRPGERARIVRHASIHRCSALSGFCYTQLTDTFLEKNGLLTEHRVPKAPIEELAKATRGPDAEQHDWYADPFGHSALWRSKASLSKETSKDVLVDWRRSGQYITHYR